MSKEKKYNQINVLKYLLIILLLVGCAPKSKCKKIPWWKRQPNSYFKSDQKSNKKKYKKHKRTSRRKNKCKK